MWPSQARFTPIRLSLGEKRKWDKKEHIRKKRKNKREKKENKRG